MMQSRSEKSKNDMTKSGLKEAIELYMSDYKRYANLYKDGDGPLKAALYALAGKNHTFTYSFWLRLSQRKHLFYPIAKWMHRRLSRKYGIFIFSDMKIGCGLLLHGMGIYINPGTVIGNNCNIHQFLSLGTSTDSPAVIGDNVYIGPNVCIVEGVRIGDNVTIGAGAVVVHDIPENATVAGCPARILNYDNPGRFIKNRFERAI